MRYVWETYFDFKVDFISLNLRGSTHINEDRKSETNLCSITHMTNYGLKSDKAV